MALTVGVVIPAYNEAETIAGVVESVSPYAGKVIVSSDGSTDRTVEVARAAGAVGVDESANSGPERATELGFIEALKHEIEILVTFDADGEHLPVYIPEMVKLVQEGSADVVVGARAKLPRFSEYLFSWYSNLRIGIRDPICGLKAIRSDVYRDIGYFDTVGGITAQFLFQAKKRHYKLAQIPIEVRQRSDIPRIGDAVTANAKMLRGLFRIILNDIGVLK
jgi:glycosyltransferase involved in cell wall biosynthesis